MCSGLNAQCPGLKHCLLFVFNASLKSEGLCFIADCIKAKHQQRRDRITTIKRKEQATEALPSTASSLHRKKADSENSSMFSKASEDQY